MNSRTKQVENSDRADEWLLPLTMSQPLGLLFTIPVESVSLGVGPELFLKLSR